MATENLNCEYVSADGRSIDWQGAIGEDLDGWTAYELVECDGCKRDVLMTPAGNGEGHCNIEDEIAQCDADCKEQGHEDCQDPECEGDRVTNECEASIYFEGPMMNYWYPCAWEDAREAALKIKHLPLCLVEFSEDGPMDGMRGLALTGGGMNLAFEICEAYVLLGYLPPLEFAKGLYGGRGADYRDPARVARVLEACKESARCAMRWAQNAIDDLDLLEKYNADQAAERAAKAGA